MLNAFVHDLHITIGQWSVGAEKSNEPTVMCRRLKELIESHPVLKSLTGDAIFTQRPLAELLNRRGIDCLFQMETNQGDTLDALTHCFAFAVERPPAAETADKKGICTTFAASGLI